MEEADLSGLVCPHQTDQDHVSFLALEAVDGVHRDELAERLEESIPLDQAPQVIDLCLVGRDDTEVDLFFQYPFLVMFSI